MAKRKIDYGMAKMVSQGAALAEHEVPVQKQGVSEVQLNKLVVNPYQPRIEMEEQALKELSNSIKKQGLLQPIVVAKDNENYTIIAGHRRVSAHKLLGKEYIKAIIKENVVHAQLAILPLVENLQRSDMDPIENAIAFKRILDEKIVKKQTELANLVGVSTSWLSKTLSILKLPNDLLSKIKKEKYTDITVLSALNKIEVKSVMSVFNTVKTLKRNEALTYIKSVLSDNNQKVINAYKRSKSKISIDLSSVDDDKIKKVESLLNEIEKILK